MKNAVWALRPAIGLLAFGRFLGLAARYWLKAKPVVTDLQSVTIENGVCNPVADYKSALQLRRDFNPAERGYRLNSFNSFNSLTTEIILNWNS